MAMIAESVKKDIISIWDKYDASEKINFDNTGVELDNFDNSRTAAIADIKGFISNFNDDSISVGEFKTQLDSYNKQNNLWGFTAIKGQMFFNQLVKTAGDDLANITSLLQQVIKEPANLDEAIAKIKRLEEYCSHLFSKATDKRKAPNPKSVGYFLSYFWQIANHEKWPVLYSSMIITFSDLGLWKELASQQEAYQYFFNLNEEVKDILSKHAGHNITNWNAEHAFWNHKQIKIISAPKAANPESWNALQITPEPVAEVTFKANFELSDYLIPKVAKLVELGGATDKSGSAKGYEFEKMVAEVFNLMNFEVESLGQGTGRNPDLILKYRDENVAFLVDAKAYGNGYSLGLDDRAIREYINYYSPKLQREGYKKIGFIIVSNSFKTNLESFISDITWNTEAKRFLLLTSEALLYLLAYKTKDKLSVPEIIQFLANSSAVITVQSVVEEFGDV